MTASGRMSWILSVPLLCSGLLAADGGASPLSGTWENRDNGEKWTFEQKDDKLHVQMAEKEEIRAEFTCNTEGKDCKIKQNGRDAKISMWFSGPRLVQLITQGSNVVKRRFAVNASGDALELEVIPVVPAGETKKFLLHRVGT